jgi:hypothetical protein
MMSSGGSNGEVGPLSTTSPSCFVSLRQITLVSTFTQNSLFPLASGVLGVAEAALALRLTSTEHGCVGDPQVLAVVHNDSGVGSRQVYDIFFCACAA